MNLKRLLALISEDTGKPILIGIEAHGLPYMLSLTMVQSRSETRMKRCGCERTFDAMFASLTAPLLFTPLARAIWYRSPQSQGVNFLPGAGPTRVAVVRCGARNLLVTFSPIDLA